MRDNLGQCGGSAAEPGIAGETAEATGKVREEEGCPGSPQWVSERLRSLPKVPFQKWSWNSKQGVCVEAQGVGLRMTGATHPCHLRLAPRHQQAGLTEQRSSLSSSSHLSATTCIHSSGYPQVPLDPVVVGKSYPKSIPWTLRYQLNMYMKL